MTSDFNPYSPQAYLLGAAAAANEATPLLDDVAMGGVGPWRDRELLVVTSASRLPDYCFKCDEPVRGFRIRRVAQHRAWWIYGALLLGPVFWLALLLAPRDRVVVRLGLCRQHRRRRAMQQSIGGVLAVCGVLLFFGAALFGEGNLGALGLLVACLLVALGPMFGMLLSTVSRTREVNGPHAWIAGASEKFLNRLPNWRE